MRDDMVFVDQKCGDGAALNGVKQSPFSIHQFLSTCLCENILLFGQLDGGIVKPFKKIFNPRRVVLGFADFFQYLHFFGIDGQLLQYGACFEKIDKPDPGRFGQQNVFTQTDVLGQFYDQIQMLECVKCFIVRCGENPHVPGINQADGFGVEVGDPENIRFFGVKILTEKRLEQRQAESAAPDNGNMCVC